MTGFPIVRVTRMGVGYFVTSRNTWYVDSDAGAEPSEIVATMLFRVLKFVPRSREGS